MVPDNEILEDFKRRLTLSYNGKSYPVYTVPPKNPDQYVLINNPEYTDDSTKDHYIYECTVLFDIVTKGGERGIWGAANDLMAQIQYEIINRPILTVNYTSTVDPYVDSVNSVQSISDGGNILRKLLRIRFKLQQNGYNF